MLGCTWHSRYEKLERHFSYGLFFLALDTQELQQLAGSVSIFGYNRLALVSIWDRDYLGSEKSSIHAKLLKLLSTKGFSQPLQRAILVTTPRVFGFAFNPVSFYLCYDDQNRLYALVGEVNNTFDETHCYVLPAEQSVQQQGTAVFEMPKVFFVSPFMDTTGKYRFTLKQQEASLEMKVELFKEEQLVFSAGLQGKEDRFETRRLLAALIGYPLTGWCTLPRIYWHAFKLYFTHKIGTNRKPPALNRSMFKFETPRLLARWTEYFVNRSSK